MFAEFCKGHRSIKRGKKRGAELLNLTGAMLQGGNSSDLLGVSWKLHEN